LGLQSGEIGRPKRPAKTEQECDEPQTSV
jgi:hypothetical protein